MLVLAHRGLHRHAPENTLDAFAAAVALGCHGIETDVRATSDGEAVLIHDRVTPDGVAVETRTRRQLEAALGHPVPLLAEALELDRAILWNIEIKTFSGWRAARSTLRAAARTHRLLISSFHWAIALEAAADGLDGAVLSASATPTLRGLLDGARTRPRAVVWDYEILDETLLREGTALGLEHYAYGVQTGAEVGQCRTIGLAGIILDQPQLALQP